MFKKTFSLLIGLFLALNIQAQNFNDFKPLRSTGAVPESFRKNSSEKYKEDLKTNISTKDKRMEKKAKKEVLLESNFQADEFLLSGKVLFNDPVGLYVTKVLDKLLEHDPELRKKLEVYVVKSPIVNAFTFSNGIIFVNLGLIAQLENESQLAYILSHEIVHYTNKHTITKYIESEKINRGNGMYRKKSFEDKLLAKSQYSKELETEADLEGLEIYLNSEYSLKSLDGVFDVLKYSYLPFDDIKFDKSFLETKHLKLPQNYFLKKTNPIKPEAENDSLSTHPAVEKRRVAIKEKIANEDDKNRKDFIIGRNEFATAQKLARFEISTLYLKNREYEAALYNSYLLLKKDTGSKYLKTSVLKSLYGLAKYANIERFDEIHLNPEKIQGKSHQVYNLFEKLSSKEINAIALNYAWRLNKQYPGDEEIEALTHDLFADLALYHFPVKTFFYSTPKQTQETEQVNADEPDLKADTTEEDSIEVTEVKLKESAKKKAIKANKKRGNKLKKRKKKNRTKDKVDEANPDYYLKYAFVEQMQDTIFLAMYDDKVKEKKVVVAEKRKQKRFSYKEAQRRLAEENRKKGYALGIDKLVIVNPFYLKLDESKKKSPQRIASEIAQEKLDNQIIKISGKAGLDVQLLDKKNLSVNGAGTLNDLAYLSDWIIEKFEHNDLEFTNFKEEAARNITAAYGTRYYCWMGVISIKKDPELILIYPKIVTGLMFPPAIPYFLYTAVKPSYETYFYSVIVDLQTGKKIYSNVHRYNLSDRNDVLHSHLYDVFLQFKSVRDKELKN